MTWVDNKDFKHQRDIQNQKKGKEMNNQLNDIRMEAKAEGMTIKKGGVYYGSRGWTLIRGLAEIAECSDLHSIKHVIEMQKELRLKRK